MAKETRALWWGGRCVRICRVEFICLMILIDWIPKDLEWFGRRCPYTKTEKQAMSKKLLDEIMDSVFNLKI